MDAISFNVSGKYAGALGLLFAGKYAGALGLLFTLVR